MTHRSILALCVVLLAGGACTPDRTDPMIALSTEVAACPDHEIDGNVTCYRVTVPENPDLPEGRTIGLEVMVLEARGGDGRTDPLFVIPGGPGQSATRSAGPRSYFADVFDPVREERDVILLAPRGTAGSGELALDPSPETLFEDLATVMPVSWAREARPRLERDADLTMYTTSHVVDDMETTRVALGYGKLNIYGTSYGTRVAQLYAVRYPDRVRTLILKAPVPPSVITQLTYTSGAQRALDALFDLCREQPSCRDAYPDLADRFDDLMEDLRDDSVRLDVTNPFTGGETTVLIDDSAFGYVLRNLMMPASGGATVLALIDQASNGDFSLLSRFVPALRAGYATALAGGMTLSVIGSEDSPRVTERMLRQDAEAGFLRGAVARGIMEATAEWPRAELPSDVHNFLEGDTPTLVVAGAFDPATPPEFAEEIADRLSNVRVVVFPGGAHSANNFEGLGGIMSEFIQTGEVDGLDLSAARENRPLPLVPSG